jgi:malonyl CoA-acyl carrier protein transacylase
MPAYVRRNSAYSLFVKGWSHLMRAYLFPGQGAQTRGMGANLFDHFREYTAEADNLLGYSIKTLCLDDAAQQLNKTQYTQPALYVVNALMYLKTLEETGETPDYVAGHSLGEYNALFAAGVFDFMTGLALVKKRGELMSQAQNGSMLAVLGLHRDQLTQALEAQDLQGVTIANYNSYKQMVISGSREEVERARVFLTECSAAHCIPLPVSGAFHSPLMQEAQHEFAGFIEKCSFATPKVPVIANLNASAYHPEVIKSNLIHHMTHSVEWTKTIEYLQTKPNIHFKEIGPGRILTQLLKRISNQE